MVIKSYSPKLRKGDNKENNKNRWKFCLDCLEKALSPSMKKNETACYYLRIHLVETLDFEKAKWINVWEDYDMQKICEECPYKMEHIVMGYEHKDDR